LILNERRPETAELDRETKLATDLQTLRALCNEIVPREERQRLMDSLHQNNFTEPEHQIVFGSVRALFLRGPISPAQLRIHLTNRGFPDTDVEKYFQPETSATIRDNPPSETTA
jgi:hypothetical protein